MPRPILLNLAASEDSLPFEALHLVKVTELLRAALSGLRAITTRRIAAFLASPADIGPALLALGLRGAELFRAALAGLDAVSAAGVAALLARGTGVGPALGAQLGVILRETELHRAGSVGRGASATALVAAYLPLGAGVAPALDWLLRLGLVLGVGPALGHAQLLGAAFTGLGADAAALVATLFTGGAGVGATLDRLGLGLADDGGTHAAGLSADSAARVAALLALVAPLRAALGSCRGAELEGTHSSRGSADS